MAESIEKWLQNEENYGRRLLARDWHEELTVALFDERKPTGWYNSAQQFSRHLTQVRSDLQKVYKLKWEKGTSRETHNRLVYWIEK